MGRSAGALPASADTAVTAYAASQPHGPNSHLEAVRMELIALSQHTVHVDQR